MTNVSVHEHAAGLTWVCTGELLARASHALDADGSVWFVDPVDVPEAMARAAELGKPAGVLQLLDRHPRDSAAIASRLGVPLVRLPSALPQTPFTAFDVISVPRWREVGLWWAQRKTLVVPEAVGTVGYFAVGDGAVGVHPFVRAFGVSALRRFAPELLLVGHGPPVEGSAAASGLGTALDRSRSDLPRLLSQLPRLLRSR